MLKLILLCLYFCVFATSNGWAQKASGAVDSTKKIGTYLALNGVICVEMIRHTFTPYVGGVFFLGRRNTNYDLKWGVGTSANYFFTPKTTGGFNQRIANFVDIEFRAADNKRKTNSENQNQNWREDIRMGAGWMIRGQNQDFNGNTLKFWVGSKLKYGSVRIGVIATENLSSVFPYLTVGF